MEIVAAAHVDSPFHFSFREPTALPDPLLVIEGASVGYGEREILAKIGMTLRPGCRIGLLGRNGAGKSTLMKLIAGELEPLAGERLGAPDLEIGFFAQLELEQLDSDSTALLELRRRGGTDAAQWPEQRCRDHLGRFGFGGERVFEPVARFSGGERARLSLAILVARRPNLLLLDEPTNHLDFDMRESLLLALQDFTGAVVIVSHDRALLRGVCDEFLIVGDSQVTPFDGDLEDYAQWLSRPADASGGSAAAAAVNGSDTPASRERGVDARRRAAARRAELAPLRDALRKTEQQLATFTQQRGALEQRMSEPAFYTAVPVIEQVALQQQHASLTTEIDALETRWLELGDELAAAEAAPG
jgi:ATP-binding cassette subfamily F protein 3